MTYKGHIATGFLITTPVFAKLGVEPNTLNLSLFAVVTIFFSLLPDIDTSKSYIANRNIFFKIFAFVLSIFVKHRGITHSVFFVAIVSFGMFYFTNKYYPQYSWLSIIAGVAYFSHLIADALTKEGVAFLYPLITKRFHLLPETIAFTTGGIGELFIMFVFLMGVYCEFQYFVLK